MSTGDVSSLGATGYAEGLYTKESRQAPDPAAKLYRVEEGARLQSSLRLGKACSATRKPRLLCSNEFHASPSDRIMMAESGNISAAPQCGGSSRFKHVYATSRNRPEGRKVARCEDSLPPFSSSTRIVAQIEQLARRSKRRVAAGSGSRRGKHWWCRSLHEHWRGFL